MADIFAPSTPMEYVSPKEQMEWEHEDKQMTAAFEHEVTVARLNVDAKRQLAILQKEEAGRSRAHAERMKEIELEIRKLDVQWSSWLKIPTLIIKLPVLVLFGIAYIVAVAANHEVDSEMWRFIRG